ncbi:MAG: outer membrane beta-barrel protein, partial [Thermoguttaceae bacterium]|nr:outer membrane beta-barrel protein [Thermoguttaceae bacterium]
DFMFGEDSRFFRSSKDFDHSWYTGHMFDPLYYSYDTPSYGFAMPQLYLEAAINNWSVKLGHFNALLGYERATAPSRFFYSKGLTCVASPTSQTGVLATFNGFENLDVTLGWVSGWGCAYDNCGMFPNENTDESMITGAFTYHINEYAYLRYAFLAGTTTMDDVFGFMGPYAFYVADQYKGLGNAHSVVLDLQLTGRLESVSTLMYGDFRYGFNSDVLGAYYTILGQHLYYTLNCCWKVGFRGEWMNISNGVGTELTSFAIGANWHPAGNQNLYVRPELRYDRAIGGMSGEMLNYRPDQFTIGFDIMLTF